MSEKVFYSINVKAPLFCAKSSEVVTSETVLFVWIKCPTLLCLVLCSLVYGFREKVLRYLMLGCRFSFTKEAPEEVERNPPLLSPPSTKFLGASPGSRQALPGPCLPLFPRHFSSAAPCCSWEHDAALDRNSPCPLSWARHCQPPALYSAPSHIPVDCTEVYRERRESR